MVPVATAGDRHDQGSNGRARSSRFFRVLTADNGPVTFTATGSQEALEFELKFITNEDDRESHASFLPQPCLLSEPVR